MPFVAVADNPVCAISVTSFVSDEMVAVRFADFADTDVMRSTLDKIQIGSVEYPLRRTVQATYIPGQGDYLVEGFSPAFIGHGKTQAEAFQNWKTAVHATFQELLHKRPFELTDADRRNWTVLSEQIDVTLYRNRIPIQIRQFGRVTKARPYPQQITWEDGCKEQVNLEIVDSPDFVTYKPGQPLEALVARDPITFAMLRILHVERRSNASRMPSEEEHRMLEGIGSARSLEEVDWD